MLLDFKNLPVGNLPYEDINFCKQMMLKLYEKVPFLPELPLIDSNDNVLNKTFSNMPCVQIKDGKLIIPESVNDKILKTTENFDKIYNSDNPNDFSKYSYDSPYLTLYCKMLKRLKPKFTVINLIGPFSFINMIFNRTPVQFLTDKVFRKFVIQTISIKTIWFINKIKEYSPETTPIIIFEENMLYKFGTLKRTNESVTQDSVVSLMSKVFREIKTAGALVCVQSFNKCNWQLVFDTKAVDIISFDAYNNSNNLSILAPEVQHFLNKGGIINWGIVPTLSTNVLTSMNFDTLYQRFISTVDNLASEGVSSDSLYKQSTVSLQGNVANLPIILAEKALILCEKLSKKL